jgi:hypothetical protein
MDAGSPGCEYDNPKTFQNDLFRKIDVKRKVNTGLVFTRHSGSTRWVMPKDPDILYKEKSHGIFMPGNRV